MRQIVLNQRDTGLTQAFPTRNDQHQHSRSRTDEHRVHVHTETLNKTLLDRVRGVSSRGSVRNRTHTGFVGEETALDTVHHGCTNTSAHHGIKTERTGNDLADHCRNRGDVHEHHDQGQTQIKTGHDRHHHLNDFGDTTHATHQNEGGQCCRDNTRGRRRKTESPFQRQSHRVGLHGIEDQTVRDRD